MIQPPNFTRADIYTWRLFPGKDPDLFSIIIRLGISLALGLSVVLTLLTLMNFRVAAKSQRDSGEIAAILPADDGQVITVCLTPGCDYQTIQAAVDAASPGQVIKVAAGVYTGVSVRNALTQVVYLSKTVTIQGGYKPGDWQTPNPIIYRTTLDAQGQGRVMYIAGAVSPTLSGLTLTGGNAAGLGGGKLERDSGGGLYVLTASVTLREMRLFSNTAGMGGGIYLQDSPAVIQNSHIFSNIAEDGGGLCLIYSPAHLSDNLVSFNHAERGAGLSLLNSEAELIGNRVISNVSVASRAEFGGGLFLESSQARLKNNLIGGNEASSGGGVYLIGSPARLESNTIISNTGRNGGGGLSLTYSMATITGNIISGNYAYDGGGLYLEGSDKALIRANLISHNQAGRGGGLWLMQSDQTTLSDNQIISNTAAGMGGGVYFKLSVNRLSGNILNGNLSHGNGGGLSITDGSQVTLDKNFIQSNAADGNGGGLEIYFDSQASLFNNFITNNQTHGLGSGVYMEDSSARLLHTTLADNTGGDGSGLHLSGSSAVLTNTILAGHTVGLTASTGSTATLAATLWANTVNWAGVGTIFTGTINLWGNPAFVNPQQGDYHFSRHSPAHDAGLPTELVSDIDGQVRPQDQAADIGADEYAGVGVVVLREPAATWLNVGQISTYTLGVANVGTEPATDVVLTETTDPGQHILAATPAVGKCNINSMGAGDEAVCQLGTISAGMILPVTLTVEIAPQVRPGQVLSGMINLVANETIYSAPITTYGQDCYVRINDGVILYHSVQAAVDAAKSGDLIKVAGVCLGVHQQSGLRQQVYLNKSLTIQGGYVLTNWNIPAPKIHPTTLDALGQGRVFYLSPAISVTLTGLNLRGGNAAGLNGGPDNEDAGGGLYAVGANLYLKDSQVFSNVAIAGGGLYLEGGEVQLSDNYIVDNQADVGGGIHLEACQATFSHNNISGNAARVYGGGLFFNEGQITLTSNIIQGNQSIAGIIGDAGGLFIGASQATLKDNLISDNTASGSGGGLSLSGAARLDGNTFITNTADMGGGLYLSGANVMLQRNTFQANAARFAGGGLDVWDSQARLDGNIISGNQARQGAGLRLIGTTAAFTNDLVTDNEAGEFGSGLSMGRASTTQMLHVTVAGNHGGDGSGLTVEETATAALTNTVLVGHLVALSTTTGSLVSLEGILWGADNWANQQDWAGPGRIITGSVSLWADPGFICTSGNCPHPYMLNSNSPAIDAGVPVELNHDIEGQPRPVGAGHDIGADEYIEGKENLVK